MAVLLFFFLCLAFFWKLIATWAKLFILVDMEMLGCIFFSFLVNFRWSSECFMLIIYLQAFPVRRDQCLNYGWEVSCGKSALVGDLRNALFPSRDFFSSVHTCIGHNLSIIYSGVLLLHNHICLFSKHTCNSSISVF